MDKQRVIQQCNGILLNHRKQWNTDRCYNTDDSWKYYSKQSQTQQATFYSV